MRSSYTTHLVQAGTNHIILFVQGIVPGTWYGTAVNF